MSSKYKGLSNKTVRNSTMRNWFSSILEQTGGMTRYVDMLNKKDDFGIYTANADKLYTEMLDKCIKLEPKETAVDNTITIKLDIPTVVPELAQAEVIDIPADTYTIDDTPTNVATTIVNPVDDNKDNHIATTIADDKADDEGEGELNT